MEHGKLRTKSAADLISDWRTLDVDHLVFDSPHTINVLHDQR
jgi:hypothetical protein